MKKILAAAVIVALSTSVAQAQRGRGSGGPSAASVDGVTLGGGAPQDNAALQSKMRAAMRHVLATPAITNMTGYQLKLMAGYGGKRGDQSSFSKGPRQVEGVVGIARIGGAGDLPNIKIFFNSPHLLSSANWAGEPDVYQVRPELFSANGIARVPDGDSLKILITKPDRPVILPLTKAEAATMELAGLRRTLAAKPGDAYTQSKVEAVEAALASLSPAQKTQRACFGDLRNPAKRYDCPAKPTRVFAKLNPAYLAGAPKNAVRSMTVSLDYMSKMDVLSAAIRETDMRALQALLD
ncbi:hypothetical protein [Allosphingosinicella vermicomposti]|uniref:hypothetical protein n=1 Tax=Allosphingosinicella vermicomposti TaxID=614671 RepID=UPI000D103D5C|nr:hypothetical protein [Allosphingosinicella vermicomposti]